MFRKLRVIIGKLKLGKIANVFSKLFANWRAQKRSKQIIIGISFVVVLSAGIFGINYLNNASAAWIFSKTWTTQSDFETGTIRSGVDMSSVPGDIKLSGTLDYPVDVDSGVGNTLVVMNSGKLYGRGYNANGQLGLGASAQIGDWTQAMTGAKSVYMGYFRSYALKTDGTLWATGNNEYGSFGVAPAVVANNTVTTSWINTGLTNVKSIAVGSWHVIALKNDGTIWGAGRYSENQLGSGVSSYTSSWVQLATANRFGASPVSSISAGRISSYVIQEDGSFWELGVMPQNRVNYGSWTKNATVTNVSKVATNSVSSGGAWYDDAAFVLKKDGTLWSIGANQGCLLGTGDCGVRSSWYQTASNVSDVTVGSEHAIYKSNSGALYGVGWSQYGDGRLGNLGNSNVWQPMNNPLVGGSSVLGLSSGYLCSLIIDSNHRLYAGGGCYATNVSVGSFGVSTDAIFRNNLSGSVSGFVAGSDVGDGYRWGIVAASSTGSTVSIQWRGASSTSSLSSASWSTIASNSSIGRIYKVVELQALLNTTVFGSVAPNTSLQSLTVNYSGDLIAPANPTGVRGYSDPSHGAQISDNSWDNGGTPSFEFYGASDNSEGSGVAGYYVYFGYEASIDPFTALSNVYIANVADPQTFNADADGRETSYLRVVTVDNAGNRSVPVTLFTYNLDTTSPTVPSIMEPDPIGYSADKNFKFSWGGATDDVSGVAGYQYKIGGAEDDWTGATNAVHNVGASVLSASADPAEVVSGKNTFWIRSKDIAGNYSTVEHKYFYYSGASPSAPIAGASPVLPADSSENTFTFRWFKPEFLSGEIIGYRYSINDPNPDSSHTTFIGLSSPGVSYDPNAVDPNTGNKGLVTFADVHAATKQGDNTIYIVAVGRVGAKDVVSYAAENILAIKFTCNTPAPGIPLEVKLFDTSDRDKATYSVAVKWVEPLDKGLGFAGYDIERSTDGVTFSNIGSTMATSFVDAGLSSINYYYRIYAKNDSGGRSQLAQQSNDQGIGVPIVPTGRFSAPPLLVGPVEKTVKVSTAAFVWKTGHEEGAAEHKASSFVEFSESPVDKLCSQEYGTIQGQMESTYEHTVNVTGLKPDTSYYYRVKFVDKDGNIGCSSESGGDTFRTLPAPRVERVSIQDVRLYTAVLTWYTSEPARAALLYGKTSNYTTTLDDVSGGLTTVHSVRLDNLEHSSTYHFAIRLTDSDGNQIMSDDYSFDTQQYPKLSNVRFQPLADQSTATFKVTWDSNVPTTSVVESQPEGGKQQETVKTKLETKHEIIVSNLLDNTFYLMNAVGVDQYGNRAVSDVNRVKTAFDTRPPVISSVAVEVSNTDFGMSAKSQVVVSWETDEPSTSQVEYDFGVSGSNYSIKSQEDPTLTTSHVLVITDLRPSSSYHLRAVSKDASGNQGVSEDQSTLTEQARSSVLDMIIGSIQSSLGWLFGMGN